VEGKTLCIFVISSELGRRDLPNLKRKTNMKKILFTGLAALAVCVSSYGQFSLSVDVTYATEYIFRGVQLGDGTLHPSIEGSSDDFYAGIWFATPLEKRNSAGWSDEVDVYAGYTPALSDTVSLDLGVGYYTYPSSDNTMEPFVGANFDLGGVTPGIYVYRDLDLDTWTYQANVGYSVPLESMGASLDLSASLGYVDPDDGDSYSYWGASAVIPYKLADNATVSVGLHYASNDLVFAEDNFFYGTVGITVGF
jgi:uncharacterized protein (TIGR02001 family)